MKKSYKVKFFDLDGKETIFDFLTEDVNKAISEYSRTHPVADYEILEEQVSQGKQILLG